MTPTPPSTTSSSTGQSPDAQYRVVRKRNRVPLSCAPCRHRKLKCNRAHPCDNCTKRGDVASCTYATPSNRKRNQTSHGSSSSPDEMQSRIDRLEGLVLSLMTNGAQSAGPAAAASAVAGSVSGSSADAHLDIDDSQDMIKEDPEGEEEEDEVDHVAKSLGVMKVDNNRAVFASEAHWYAILGELSEVKTYFNEHKKQYDEQLKKYKAAYGDSEAPGTSFLFSSVQPADRETVLASFPSKPVADKLISRYFNHYDPSIHIVHGPTFQKEYDQHWLTPHETPIIWIGLCFSMMCIASQSYGRAGDEPFEYKGKSKEMAKTFRRLTTQCLYLADITQPIAYMLETLLLHIQAEYGRARDSEIGILVSVSIIVRLAMRMGYHRDPGPYASVAPFQGEMRRRVWSVVRQCDLLFSSQSGLPPMIRAKDTNTEFPRNIYDDELWDGIQSLPESRPLTEMTPVSYMNAKSQLVYLYGEVIEETQSVTCPSYESIMKLDQRLREAQAMLPPHFKMRPIEDSIRDSSSLIMQRFILNMLVLKSLCVLHRKYLSLARKNPRFAYSRRTCIDTCMEMLQHQVTLHTEAFPGGRLSNVSWFIASLTTHDFLLAAMMVCLDLYHTAEAECKGRTAMAATDVYGFNQERRESMLIAIERSVKIWGTLKDSSMEAFKAHATLTIMLEKLRNHEYLRRPQQMPRSGFGGAGMADMSGVESMNVAPEHSAAMTLGMLSSGGVTTPGGSTNMFDSVPGFTFTPDMASDISGSTSTSQASQQPPQQQAQTSGLTPNFSGDAVGGPINAPSPFSSLFGPNLGLQGVDIPGADMTWDAWDSYVQGNDQLGSYYNLDSIGVNSTGLDALGGGNQPAGHRSQGQAASQDGPTTQSGSGSVFMGVNTPDKGNVL
ncbi:fungal-specific transcription factor domain-containing protein [Lineolata rhizophorae]|uniref:Fungal-specific transcription factor domain-containing protein n=1 Tax=Lineolata rhizophorae TaxID=578093 RepID=A0A6A6P798_9PEZI|nr:fungal-specific transcription factor domain-containing protein [Lineolata rhizophorae]